MGWHKDQRYSWIPHALWLKGCVLAGFYYAGVHAVPWCVVFRQCSTGETASELLPLVCPTHLWVIFDLLSLWKSSFLWGSMSRWRLICERGTHLPSYLSECPEQGRLSSDHGGRHWNSSTVPRVHRTISGQCPLAYPSLQKSFDASLQFSIAPKSPSLLWSRNWSFNCATHSDSASFMFCVTPRHSCTIVLLYGLPPISLLSVCFSRLN